VRRRGLTDSQKKRLALFDNRAAELAEWNPEELVRLEKECPEALEGMFQDGELETILEECGIESHAGDADAEPQIDRAAELNKKWQVKPGDLWRIGEHRLLCGDSTKREDVERVMGGDTPLLMVTDPPYGVEYDANWRNEADRANGKPYGARAVGKVTNDDRADWSEAWALFSGDVAYVWHAGGKSPEVAESLTSTGFELRNLIVWAKNNFAISRGHYHHQHEPCWYVFRSGKTANFIGDRSQTTLWQIDKPQKSETGHSTQKPVECMARPIRNHEAAEVYDPFLGSGTTMVACENLKRKCRGIEISPDYCSVILQRMQDAFGLVGERIAGDQRPTTKKVSKGGNG
jgi:DNA modification methylase